MSDKPNLTQRAYASGVVLSLFGLVSVTGKLVPVKATGASKKKQFKQVCPKCVEPTPIKRVHTCPSEHGPFQQDELLKAKEVEKKLFFVDPTEIEETRESALEKTHMTVWAHQGIDLYPSAAGYRFFPTASIRLYPVFTHLADNYTLVGVMNMRGNDTFYRLDMHNNDLVLQPVVFPADLGPSLDVEVDTDKEIFSMAMQLAEKNIKDFDPEAYFDTTDSKFAELVAKLEGGGGVDVPKQGKKDKGSEDALVALASALEVS